MPYGARGSQALEDERSSRDLALRTHPLTFGVIVFLASELMFFGGLITSYFVLRSQAALWPPPGVALSQGPEALGTAFLGVSSFTMLMTTHNVAKHRTAVARTWLAFTIVLGLGYLAIAVRDWTTAPFRIDSNAYGSLYYVMTGIHAVHVAAGVVMLAILLGNITMTAFERDRRAGMEAISYYWHFVFVVWVMIWGTIFIVR